VAFAGQKPCWRYLWRFDLSSSAPERAEATSPWRARERVFPLPARRHEAAFIREPLRPFVLGFSFDSAWLVVPLAGRDGVAKIVVFVLARLRALAGSVCRLTFEVRRDHGIAPGREARYYALRFAGLVQCRWARLDRRVRQRLR